MRTERRNQIEAHKPISLTPEQKALVEEYIGKVSDRHQEPYVRSRIRSGPYIGELTQHEIWYLAPTALTGSRPDKAIMDLAILYELSQEEAQAVVLFCRAFPETAKELNRKHTDSFPETRRVAQSNPYAVLKLK